MKIGILTHHFIANFGAFLQAYALQNVVQGLFPQDEVKIINYIDFKHFIINNGGWFRYYFRQETFKIWVQKICLPMSFYNARRKYMSLTSRCYTSRGINKLGFDVIIVGSDEVWNFNDDKSNSKIKFGIGLKPLKLISYAASIGNSKLYPEVPSYVKNGLKKFSAISVRDSVGQKFVEQVIGKSPIKVLDPTFLIDLPTEKVNLPVKKYILFYYAEKLPQIIAEQIFTYAQDHGMAVYGAGEGNKRYTAITINLTPFQWVWMFKHARFIITGTFHGAALSIENKKQFWVYLTQENRKIKVRDLLNMFEINDREIADSFDFSKAVQSHEIDYSKVGLQKKREESLEYLRTAINVHEIY